MHRRRAIIATLMQYLSSCRRIPRLVSTKLGVDKFLPGPAPSEHFSRRRTDARSRILGMWRPFLPPEITSPNCNFVGNTLAASHYFPSRGIESSQLLARRP